MKMCRYCQSLISAKYKPLLFSVWNRTTRQIGIFFASSQDEIKIFPQNNSLELVDAILVNLFIPRVFLCGKWTFLVKSGKISQFTSIAINHFFVLFLRQNNPECSTAIRLETFCSIGYFPSAKKYQIHIHTTHSKESYIRSYEPTMDSYNNGLLSLKKILFQKPALSN